MRITIFAQTFKSVFPLTCQMRQSGRLNTVARATPQNIPHDGTVFRNRMISLVSGCGTEGSIKEKQAQNRHPGMREILVPVSLNCELPVLLSIHRLQWWNFSCSAKPYGVALQQVSDLYWHCCWPGSENVGCTISRCGHERDTFIRKRRAQNFLSILCALSGFSAISALKHSQGQIPCSTFRRLIEHSQTTGDIWPDLLSIWHFISSFRPLLHTSLTETASGEPGWSWYSPWSLTLTTFWQSRFMIRAGAASVSIPCIPIPPSVRMPSWPPFPNYGLWDSDCWFTWDLIS